MNGFHYHRRSGHVIATFSGFEADLLRSLASQLVELLRNEAAVPTSGGDSFEAMMDFSGPTVEPEDPVLARLFPTAYPHDEEAAAEFRRFTEGALRDDKANGAATVIGERTYGAGCGFLDGGLPLELPDSGLEVWMPDCVRLRIDGTNEIEGIEPDVPIAWSEMGGEDRVRALVAAFAARR